jgi:hypothetical protein
VDRSTRVTFIFSKLVLCHVVVPRTPLPSVERAENSKDPFGFGPITDDDV